MSSSIRPIGAGVRARSPDELPRVNLTAPGREGNTDAESLRTCLLGSAVGRACAGATMVDGHGSATTEGTFSIMTYNVHGLPWIRPPFGKMAPLLAGHDAIYMQEIFEGRARARAYRTLGYEYVHPAVRDDGILSDGLARFSTTRTPPPVRQAWKAFHGRIGDGADAWASKGFSVAEHRLGTDPHARLMVYNLHMDAGTSAGDILARRKQLAQLRNHIEQHAANQPIVVLGDFNTESAEDRAALATFMKALGLTDSRDCAGGDQEPPLLDKVLFRGGEHLELRVASWRLRTDFRTEGGEPLSDHDPIDVHFTWKVRPVP